MAAGKKNSDLGLRFFILFALIIHVYDVWRRMWDYNFPFFEPLLFLFYLFLALTAVTFGPLKDEKGTFQYKFGKAIIISLIAYFIPIIINSVMFRLDTFLGGIVTFLAWLAMVATPVWIWYVIVSKVETSWVAQFLCFAYIIGWTGILLFLVAPTKYLTPEQVQVSAIHKLSVRNVWDQVEYGFEKFYDYFAININQIYQLATRRIQTAIDPYAARTDEQSKRRLGVFLSQLKPEPEKTFLKDYEINVLSELKADVIDTEINVNIICEGKDRKTGKIIPASEIFPYSEYSIEQPIKEKITCTFAPEFSTGIHEINMKAKIQDFKTLSYIRTFMMNKEALRALQKQGKDALQTYKVAPSELIATYTKGPLRLALKAGESPVAVDPSIKDFKMNFDMSLENLWEGSINKISRISLIVPKPFEITGLTSISLPPGKISFEKKSCISLPAEESQLCDDGKENLYELTQETIEALPKNIKLEPVIIRAKIATDKSKEILQEQPFTNKYFKATVVYDYEISKTTQITVKEASTEKE
ncbi:hypothetical protein HYV79_02605 [Candidatus Woesearchaeota archaeon]|nr:hypothetical protein [Candidatus Woesearchaeota archaeon]